MRIALGAACLLLATATPAMATGGIACRAISGRGPSLHIVIGHAVAPSVVSVRMNLPGELAYNSGNERMGSRGLAIARAWIDERLLWLDLADPDQTRWEGRLRATFQPRQRGRPAIGTFVRNGRTYRMRCVEA